MDSDLATVTGTQEVFLSPDERKSQSVHIYLIDIWVPNSAPNSVPYSAPNSVTNSVPNSVPNAVPNSVPNPVPNSKDRYPPSSAKPL